MMSLLNHMELTINIRHLTTLGSINVGNRYKNKVTQLKYHCNDPKN